MITIALAFAWRWGSFALVALAWFIPGRRVANYLRELQPANDLTPPRNGAHHGQ